MRLGQHVLGKKECQSLGIQSSLLIGELPSGFTTAVLPTHGRTESGRISRRFTRQIIVRIKGGTAQYQPQKTDRF